jgi:hypothetical protein
MEQGKPGRLEAHCRRRTLTTLIDKRIVIQQAPAA